MSGWFHLMGQKNSKNIIVLAHLFFGISIGAFAQVSATAEASGNVVAPISIIKAVDMSFGNVAVGASAGSVVLTPDGHRTQTGGLSLPGITGTVSAASFDVTGAPNFTFYITLPSTPLLVTNGSNNMTVDMFASNPDITGVLNANGTQTVKVGATLNVGALQPVGHYTSADPFAVAVNYN